MNTIIQLLTGKLDSTLALGLLYTYKKGMENHFINYKVSKAEIYDTYPFLIGNLDKSNDDLSNLSLTTGELKCYFPLTWEKLTNYTLQDEIDMWINLKELGIEHTVLLADRTLKGSYRSSYIEESST